MDFLVVYNGREKWICWTGRSWVNGKGIKDESVEPKPLSLSKVRKNDILCNEHPDWLHTYTHAGRDPITNVVPYERRDGHYQNIGVKRSSPGEQKLALNSRQSLGSDIRKIVVVRMVINPSTFVGLKPRIRQTTKARTVISNSVISLWNRKLRIFTIREK